MTKTTVYDDDGTRREYVHDPFARVRAKWPEEFGNRHVRNAVKLAARGKPRAAAQAWARRPRMRAR